MSMYQFKASIMCEECGEIHAERWLTSNNRHATNTVLFVLCESCKENELLLSEGITPEFDPFSMDLIPDTPCGIESVCDEYQGGHCACTIGHSDPFATEGKIEADDDDLPF